MARASVPDCSNCVGPTGLACVDPWCHRRAADVRQVPTARGLGSVLARNNGRVRNVQNVRNVPNMFGPRLFGTFGPNQSTSDPNQTKSAAITKSQHVEIGDVSFDLGFEW